MGFNRAMCCNSVEEILNKKYIIFSTSMNRMRLFIGINKKSFIESFIYKNIHKIDNVHVYWWYFDQRRLYI